MFLITPPSLVRRKDGGYPDDLTGPLAPFMQISCFGFPELGMTCHSIQTSSVLVGFCATYTNGQTFSILI